MTRPARLVRGFAVLTLLAATVAGCDGSGLVPGGKGSSTDETTGVAAAAVVVNTNVADDASNVPVDTVLRVTSEHGALKAVTVRSAEGRLPGRIGKDGTRWTAGDLLEPGTRYRVRTVATGADGERVRSTSKFTTQALTLDQQTYPSIAPLDGEKVGVGMPVVVTFDLPVANRVRFEKNMTVKATPKQAGSWHWLNDKEAHWRPRHYWKAGSRVSVDVDVNGVPAGGGIYGQQDRTIDFTVGDAHIYKVNAKTHQMKVFENGKLLRTMPITTGKAGFITRSGIKVVMAKFPEKRMNSETVGIPRGSAEAYDINDVKWAMRLTHSGEFIHAAPWSVGSQGSANVSHGCTGMSTADAAWLYDMTRRGDVVEYVGTDREMELGNGYGDWNLSWDTYAAGSALG